MFCSVCTKTLRAFAQSFLYVRVLCAMQNFRPWYNCIFGSDYFMHLKCQTERTGTGKDAKETEKCSNYSIFRNYVAHDAQ